MILFHSKVDFQIFNKRTLASWIKRVANKEGATVGDLNFIFCSDKFLLEKNKTYLQHNSLTDIITFNYSDKHNISGDVFISIDRVKENALLFSESFENELKRVIIHGVLHLLGYKDKSKKEKTIMRNKEDFYLSLQR